MRVFLLVGCKIAPSGLNTRLKLKASLKVLHYRTFKRPCIGTINGYVVPEVVKRLAG